jgi:hypothetical protein
MIMDRSTALIDLEARPAASPALIVGPILVAAAAVLTSVALSATTVSDQIRWGSIALAVFCVSLLPLMSAIIGYRGLGLSTWRIGPWALTWGAVAFGPATISWIGPQSGSPAEILPGSILSALWLIAVAMAMFTIGYCTGPRRVACSLARQVSITLTSRFTDDIRSQAVPWVLFGVGMAGSLTQARATGHLGYVGEVSASMTSASGYAQSLALFGECVPLAVAPAQVYTSSDVTPEGDLYRHGGWVMLIAGMFLIGCGARIIDEVTDLRRSIHGAFLIILLFPGLVQAGSDCATLLAGIPEMVLLWYVVTALSFARRSGQTAVAPAPSPPVRSR